MDIKFTRQQFPVRSCFAMTINKAQGQTLDHVGILLPEPCFTHGQLYTAPSRTGNPAGVHFMVTHEQDPTLLARKGMHTRNVVYQELLAN